MFKGFLKKQAKGFTLIEILVVIGIIAILAAIVIIAINPAKQFAQARNTQRQSGVNTVLNAVGQRIADNKGVFAGSFTIGANTYTCPALPAITTAGTPGQNITDVDVSGMTNLSCLTPTYVAALPTDPDTAWATGVNAAYTGYNVGVDPAGHVTVCAIRAATESSLPSPANICVTR